jgi:hypothetical protein
VSAARRRKKLAKEYLTWADAYTSNEEWCAYKGAATTARYDRKWRIHQLAGQFNGMAGYQAPVKYNRCKHCGYSRHCPPDLVEMKIRLDAERKARES